MPNYERLQSVDGVTKCILNKGTDEELILHGYVSTQAKSALYWLSVILTVGSSALLLSWKPSWKAKFTKKRCNISEADALLLKNIYGEVSVVEVVKENVPRSFPREYTHGRRQSIRSESDLQSCENGTLNDRSCLIGNEGFWFKYFIHRHVKYYWNDETGSFVWLKGYDINTPCNDFLEKFHGLSVDQQAQKYHLYGPNSIEVEVKSYFKLFVEEVLNPFYVFQIFSICLWFADDYMYFAACIFLITAVSMAISLYEIRKQSQTLHDMVSSVNAVDVSIIRDDEELELPSHELVPGDVMVVPSNGCIMSCDAVLISGSCIVNESMLTGESTPVMKTQLPHHGDQEIYSPDAHKRHTLFSGTQVIQTRYYGNSKVTAVVVRTGFLTAKGELVRSILFPRPMGFKFYRDAMRFVVMLFFIALGGIIYSMYIYIKGHFPVSKMIIRMLDIVTIVVPPSLPAAMTVGSVYAQNRLKKHGIFCISPPRINVCGKLKMFVFDKTGTLTEEGLDLWGIIPAKDAGFDHMVTDATKLEKKSLLVSAMATCHSLTMIEGELRGDPLDLKMFEATAWNIEEPGEDTTRYDQLTPVVVSPPKDEKSADDLTLGNDENVELPYEIGIIRQFTFSSNLQRMSVITRVLGKKNMDVFTKGAPEKIVTLCLPETVPDNFTDHLQAYAVQGYRVIAVAWKELDANVTWRQSQRIKRDDVEQGMTFLGFLVMQNTLKPETTDVIHTLAAADIRTVMATGDNMHTAISVARECGMIRTGDQVVIVTVHAPESQRSSAYLEMEYADKGGGLAAADEYETTQELSINSASEVSIDIEGNSRRRRNKYHFSMSGKTFSLIQQYFPDLVPKIVVRGTIFARMSPDQKAQLVKELQGVGYVVGMCGDGANDCGALKMADVGISLSETEASVAAPFTSKIPNIECVPIAIREGRCALVTSFSVFKYMALYSMIQFASVLILYTFKTNLGDQQFLYIDLGLATVMAIVMGYTKPYEKLVRRRPHGSLVSPPVVFSIVMQVLVVAFLQIGALVFLRRQSWYVPVSPDLADKFTACWEANVIFSISSFQYVITAAVFSAGRPFRQPLYSNWWMVASIVVFTAFNILLLVRPYSWLADFFQLMQDTQPENFTFRLWLLTFPLVNVILSVIIEVVGNTNVTKTVSRKVRRKRQPKNPYKILEGEMDSDCSWPAIGSTMYSGVST